MSNDLIIKDDIAFNKDGFLIFSSAKLEECISYFNIHQFDKAIFSGYGGRLDRFDEKDLEVLRRISVRELIIIMSGELNCEAVNSQHKLHRLEIHSDPVKQVIDFDNFPHLESFKGYWTKKLLHLFSRTSLTALHLWKYQSKSGVIEELAGLKNLESLNIIQANVKNIGGIDKLPNLKYLGLAYNKSLEVFYTGEIQLPIEELEIEMCKKLDLTSLHGLTGLKKLSLTNMGSVLSLAPALSLLPKLEQLYFSEIDLQDGDNSYFLQQPHLKKISFPDKRHYKFTCKQINNALENESERKKLLSLS
jgi:Leucine-rich repeat (LRR) protein